MTEPADEAVRLDVHGAQRAGVAGATARATAAGAGFAEADADRVGAVVTRLCELVAGSDFDDPDRARFTLTVTESPAALVVAVADHGLPIALGGDRGHEIVATLAGDPAVDHVAVRSDGDGNAVTLTVRRDPTALTHLVDEVTPTDAAPELGEPRIERLRRDHLESLARCTWRVYGHTYVADFLYHPEATWAMVEAGRLHSVVAVDDDGEVVGHVAIELEHVTDPVGDFTLALTDPRYRGHHLLGRASDELAAIIAELGLRGSLAEAVTPHTITQRSRVDGGATETGVLVGFIPSSMTYRGFSEEVQGSSRQSAVLSYQPLGPAPARTVFLPEPYAEVMAERYEAMGLERPGGRRRAPAGATRLDVAVDRPRSLATLEVQRVGADAVDEIDRRRRALCAAGTEVVYVELPLEDPGTPDVAEGLRDRGFAYAGFVPELRDVDVLRLQYLDVEVDTGIIQLYSDDARRLLAFIEADRA